MATGGLRKLVERLGAPRAKPNLVELARGLPDLGEGSKMARRTWPAGCYWTLQEVRPKLSAVTGRAWGVLTWNGREKTGLRQPIGGANKRGVWRVVEGAGGGAAGSAAAAAAAPAVPRLDLKLPKRAAPEGEAPSDAA